MVLVLPFLTEMGAKRSLPPDDLVLLHSKLIPISDDKGQCVMCLLFPANKRLVIRNYYVPLVIIPVVLFPHTANFKYVHLEYWKTLSRHFYAG